MSSTTTTHGLDTGPFPSDPGTGQSTPSSLVNHASGGCPEACLDQYHNLPTQSKPDLQGSLDIPNGYLASVPDNLSDEDDLDLSPASVASPISPPSTPERRAARGGEGFDRFERPIRPYRGHSREPNEYTPSTTPITPPVTPPLRPAVIPNRIEKNNIGVSGEVLNAPVTANLATDKKDNNETVAPRKSKYDVVYYTRADLERYDQEEKKYWERRREMLDREAELMARARVHWLLDHAKKFYDHWFHQSQGAVSGSARDASVNAECTSHGYGHYLEGVGHALRNRPVHHSSDNEISGRWMGY